MNKRWNVVALLLALGSCRALPEGASCWSIDGRALIAVPPEGPTRDVAQRQLDEARAALAAAPQDRDAAIWVGRRLGYLAQFREAVVVFTDALRVHPDDPWLLRYRGHRWITLRNFAAAVRDLASAAERCRSEPDAMEPDGDPTPGRPPHSTLHYNVHYHLGLAHWLQGDFTAAECAWLDCLAVVRNDEARVAVTHWLWCARMRRGDPAGAAAVVLPITAAMDVVENRSYHQLCLLYGGKVRVEEITPLAGSAGSALGFGVAHHALVTGDRERARTQLRELAASPGWPAFGVIAAEAELVRQAW